MSDPPAVLAFDVGNSKTDAALVAADGGVLAAARGPSGSHQAAGIAGAMRVLDMIAVALAASAGRSADPVATVASLCMAGFDLPSDRRLLARSLGRLQLAERLILHNDTEAPLRAGSERGWGVAVVCGAGINALGVGPGGRVARFAALGSISGDWGGGGELGMAALGAAVRAREGRGPRTVLETVVPAHFGVRRPQDVTIRLYDGRLGEDRLDELAPAVLAASAAGDDVARAIVDRLGDEVVGWATAALRRAGLARTDADVVLSGGLMRARDAHLLARIEAGVRAVAPAARVAVLDAPPVVGAALLGLDALATDGHEDGHADSTVEARVRAELTEARLVAG